MFAGRHSSMTMKWITLFSMVISAGQIDAAPLIVKAPVEQIQKGRALQMRLLRMQPREEFDGKAVLHRRDAKGKPLPELQASFQSYRPDPKKPDEWIQYYQAINLDGGPAGAVTQLVVYRKAGEPGEYAILNREHPRISTAPRFQGNASMKPYAGSDFWLADFGFEFFNWKDQRLVEEGMHRSQWCLILESRNPKPVAGTYARVKSWIDKDTLGLVQANAYDHQGRLLKIFKPISFKKVKGQYHLESMEIRNAQTRTRTTAKFDLRPRR
ncbi:MAG: hypothetical protein CMO66_07695 [Verrucomicrobiales bacterium]|nr:hypothetical protein [Verrucomicrobiales bacterium]